MTLQQLVTSAIKALYEHDLDEPRVTLYPAYRVFGSTCPGICGSMDDCMSVIGKVIKLAYSTPDVDGATIVDMVMNFQLDEMGCDILLYWGALDEFDEEEEEEEEEGEKVFDYD